MSFVREALDYSTGYSFFGISWFTLWGIVALILFVRGMGASGRIFVRMLDTTTNTCPLWMQYMFPHEIQNEVILYTFPVRVGTAFVYLLAFSIVSFLIALLWIPGAVLIAIALACRSVVAASNKYTPIVRHMKK